MEKNKENHKELILRIVKEGKDPYLHEDTRGIDPEYIAKVVKGLIAETSGNTKTGRINSGHGYTEGSDL